MENKQLPIEVQSCIDCIGPKNLEDGSNRNAIHASRAIYNAFIADDPIGFQSDMCVGCEEGLIPSHLPLKQVIRFIKNIFDKHNVEI